MNAAREPPDDRQNRGPTAERTCPFCGGPVLDIHGVATCLHCHAMLDTCCEGTPPDPHKVSSPPEKSPGEQARQPG
jgi:hypothetical protein